MQEFITRENTDIKFTADGERYGQPGPLYFKPTYRIITTFNAQLTKWTFLLCGLVIGYLLCSLINGGLR